MNLKKTVENAVHARETADKQLREALSAALKDKTPAEMRAVGIHPDTVKKWERGQAPTLRVARLVLDAL